MQAGLVADVKKIVILRALVLGDLIFSLPAIESLHNTYPNAQITCITRPWAVDFIAGRISAIQRVIGIRSSPDVYQDLGFLIHPEDAAWFYPQMQSEQIDLGITLQGGGKNANPFIQRLNPRVSIGSREAGAIPLDRWIAYDYYQHEVIRCLELAGLAGAAPTGWSPRLPVLPSDLAAAARHLDKIKRPYVVIHTGARDIRRIWPPEQFAVVADACKREMGFEVVLTGSAVDAKTAAQVAGAMQETPLNLSRRLSLPALVGVLANAALVISNDTGVLHLGLAVGARAVGLFWGEYVSKSMPLSRDAFYPLIAWERRCPLCGKFLDHAEVVQAEPHPCAHRVSFISAITPKQVITAVKRFIL